MPFVAEGDEDVAEDAVATRTNYSAGSGLVLNFKERKVANLANIHRRIMERNGMVLMAEGRVGCAKWPCECVRPCGFRYFPGVMRLRDLTLGDADRLLKRVWPRKDILKFASAVRSLRQENERLRRIGILRKGDWMLLGRIPGPLVRGVSHDFPEEFSTRVGQTVDIQHKNLEKVFSELFVNRCYSNRLSGVKA